jgi:hypothetical protein
MKNPIISIAVLAAIWGVYSLLRRIMFPDDKELIAKHRFNLLERLKFKRFKGVPILCAYHASFLVKGQMALLDDTRCEKCKTSLPPPTWPPDKRSLKKLKISIDFLIHMCHLVSMRYKIPDSVRRFFYKIQDFFPTRLPVGLTSFNNWCDRLLFTYFPASSETLPPGEDSFRFSIAAMILHMDSQKSKVPNRYFGKAIVKGASNEVASFVMRDLKERRDALIEQQRAEATANTAGTSSASGQA